MNKETFLQELRLHLQILEDQEQQDILDEYAQHIDMKMQKGLSEEEAIKDFGPVQELAAGILEAYHVKPEFEQKRSRMKVPDLAKATAESKKVWSSASTWLGTKTKAFGNCIQRGLSWIGKKFKGLWRWVIGPFHRKPRPEGTQEALQEQTKTGRSGSESILTGIGRSCKALWKGVVTIVKWCLRIIWNAFWLCASLLTGIGALLLLFGFGTLVILLLQGYPLAGIVLVCLGGMLCCGTIAVLCFSFLRRKTGEQAESEEVLEAEELMEKSEAESVREEEAEEAGEEVHHEQIA